MVAYNRMEQILFFPLVKIGRSWTARMKLLLSGLDMTLFVTSRDLNWNVFKMAVD